MYKINGAYPYDLSDDGGSIQSSGFSLDEPSSLRSSLSRPSGKSIYLRRKEYADSIIKQPGNFQYRVEHLFTCEVDGRDIRDLDDCIEQLKVLDAKGKVWGQDMILEVRDGCLQLTDIETKEELESLGLESIVETKAVLDTCIYNSMLTITVRDRAKRKTSIFLFQCEDVRAEHIKIDLERAIRLRGADTRDRHDNREDPEPHPEPEPEAQEEEEEEEEEPPPPREYTETDRKVDILNHILSDVELFMGRVSEVAPKEDKKKKKKMMMLKKSKKKKDIEGMPPPEEFASCLQKIKYGFNLLGELNGVISNPNAPEFIHCFFSSLEFLVPHCSPDLPPSIVSPLLTEQCIRLLSEEASQEEDQLWQSLGDAWNIPESKWPDDEEVPPYVPEFSDGWEPPMVVKAPPKKSPVPKSKVQNVNEPPPKYMRVMYDFTARNHRELSIMKGDVVQVLDQSKQWWKVRNNQQEEGYVPNNVLEPMEGRRVEEEEPQEVQSVPVLTKRSKPSEVKAWLEYKEFSKITVRCLGVLSGSLLLGMTREELKEVCPEEGGRVFFQLQAVKSALAIESERGRGHSNGR
ncbi:epidermal growth factor receptor kinase substrate 8 [Megalops cyprinoides]|uniref:epidermal growth factor receptor kinase substrate 8 n=1 Tax=Megalops cyprinoides TaxID=118141 RepID=UPI00186441C9|nr:epidermal growth factor receptor kinase substrate 8 [Megalops cyprinoides]